MAPLNVTVQDTIPNTCLSQPAPLFSYGESRPISPTGKILFKLWPDALHDVMRQTNRFEVQSEKTVRFKLWVTLFCVSFKLGNTTCNLVTFQVNAPSGFLDYTVRTRLVVRGCLHTEYTFSSSLPRNPPPVYQFTWLDRMTFNHQSSVIVDR